MLNIGPTLNVKTKTIHEVDSSNFDRYINGVLNIEFEFVPIEEANNYSSYSFNGINGVLDEKDQDKITRWKRGEFVHNSTNAILNYLVSLKLAPAGDYVITVFW